MPDIPTDTVEALQYSLSVLPRWALPSPNTIPGGYKTYVGFKTSLAPDELADTLNPQFESSGLEKASSSGESKEWYTMDGFYKTNIHLHWAKEAEGKYVYEFVVLSTIADAFTKQTASPKPPQAKRPSAGKTQR